MKIHDRIESAEMPPKKQERPPVADTTSVTRWLQQSLIAAERKRFQGGGRTALRQITRAEYENTVRDLFDLPGIALQGGLPADGSARFRQE